MSGLQQAQCRSQHRQGDRQSHCRRYRTLDTKCLHITTWQIDTCSSQVCVLGCCYRFIYSYVRCHWVVLSVASAVCCPPIWLIPRPHTPTHTPHGRSHLKQHTHTHTLPDHTHCPSTWLTLSILTDSYESVREAPWSLFSSYWGWFLSFLPRSSVCLLSSLLSSCFCFSNHRLLDIVTSL